MSKCKTKPHKTLYVTSFPLKPIHKIEYIVTLLKIVQDDYKLVEHNNDHWSSLWCHMHQLIQWRNSIHDDYELIENNYGHWSSVQYQLIPMKTVLSIAGYIYFFNIRDISRLFYTRIIIIRIPSITNNWCRCLFHTWPLAILTRNVTPPLFLILFRYIFTIVTYLHQLSNNYG